MYKVNCNIHTSPGWQCCSSAHTLHQKYVCRLLCLYCLFAFCTPSSNTDFNNYLSISFLDSWAVQQSILSRQHKSQNSTGKVTPNKQYCIYYNRFGKCNRGDRCPFVHDPDRIAICTRFELESSLLHGLICTVECY